MSPTSTYSIISDCHQGNQQYNPWMGRLCLGLALGFILAGLWPAVPAFAQPPAESDNMIVRITKALIDWWKPLTYMIYFCGLFSVVWGLMTIPKNQLKGTVSVSFMAILGGVFMLSLNPFLDSLAITLFDSASAHSSGTLSYTSTSTNPGKVYIEFAVIAMALIGLLGIARGLLLLKRIDLSNSELGRALVHIFGGIICINMPSFLKALGVTLGGDFNSAVTTIFG